MRFSSFFFWQFNSYLDVDVLKKKRSQTLKDELELCGLEDQRLAECLSFVRKN